MKILVTGAGGQLGTDVVKECARRQYECVGTDIKESYDYLDITNEDMVHRVVSDVKPDVIIHCAAWTDVDGAEKNVTKVYDLNVEATKYITEAAQEVGAKLIYISTDYVFSGLGTEPWNPDTSTAIPLNVYGLSKLAGEYTVRKCNKHYIVRISWLFGLYGKNFVNTMISIGNKHKSIKVINDQIGTPTYTVDLAELLLDMAETNKYGIYHVSNEGGYISWYDFCCEIFKQANIDTEIIPVSTEEYGKNVAVRPRNSRLDKSKLTIKGFNLLPTWQDALKRYLEVL